eukprot:2347290-Rhodomonas_salina.1
MSYKHTCSTIFEGGTSSATRIRVAQYNRSVQTRATRTRTQGQYNMTSCRPHSTSQGSRV